MLKLGMGLDTLPLVAAVERMPEIWGLGCAPDRIALRGPHHESGLTVNYPAMDMLWQARPWIFGLMARMEGEELGKVQIARIAPGASLDLVPPPGFQSYALCLMARPGLMLGNAAVAPGDAWWCGDQRELVNNSPEGVLVLLSQFRPASPSTYMPPMEAQSGD